MGKNQNQQHFKSSQVWKLLSKTCYVIYDSYKLFSYTLTLVATSHNFTTKQTLWTYTEKVLFTRKYAKLKINIVWKKFFSFLPKSTSKHCLCVSWFLFHLEKLSIFNISLQIFFSYEFKIKLQHLLILVYFCHDQICFSNKTSIGSFFWRLYCFAYVLTYSLYFGSFVNWEKICLRYFKKILILFCC